MNYDQIFENVKELHRVNFDKVLKVKDFDKENFSLTNNYCLDRRSFNEPIVGYCNACQDIKTHKDKYQDYCMQYISHGSHTIDFLQAAGYTNIKNDIFLKTDWIEVPVLFLMENPSKDYANAGEKAYRPIKNDANLFPKKPTHQWYWIHTHQRHIDDDDNRINNAIKQKTYGDMVYSLICHFRLSNAYLTNVVKCGISNDKDEFLTTDDYTQDSIDKCTQNVLMEEISALTNDYSSERLIVFAFGSRPRWIVDSLVKGQDFKNMKIQLLQLVHPASYSCNNCFRLESTYAIIKTAIEDENFGRMK